MTEPSKDLRYRAVLRSVRPGRAVTLVCADEGWETDVLRLLECHSRTWGGDGNGIVPCSRGWTIPETFWPLVGVFDADFWTCFQTNRRAIQMADPARYKEMVDADVAHFSSEHNVSLDDARTLIETGPYLSEPFWGRPPPEFGQQIRRFHAPLGSAQVTLHGHFRADEPPPHDLVDMCRLTHVPEQIRTLDTSQWPMAVQLLVATRTGGLQPSHRELLAQRGAKIETTVVADSEQLGALLEFGWTGQVDMASRRLTHAVAQGLDGSTPEIIEPVFADEHFLPDTPLGQSRLGSGWLRRLRPDDDPIVVVCGVSLEDFSYAFTLQRLMGRVYWFPAGPSDQLDDFDEVLRRTFTAVISARHDTTPIDNPSVLLTSLTLGPDELDRLLVELQATPWGSCLNGEGVGGLTVEVVEPSAVPMRRDLLLVDEVHYPKESFEPFLGNELARTLDIPVPSKATGIQPSDCRWQVDVEDFQHILPARWVLHSILGSADGPTHRALRSSTAGISVDSHARGFVFGGGPLAQVLAQVRIRFPSAREVFECLLASVGGSIEESDKGSFARRMIDLWGGFTALTGDLEGSTRSLLRSWVKAKSDATPGIVKQQRRYLRLGDVMKLTGMKIDDARDLLDGYLRRDIISRGLLFTCAVCRGTSFYRLEDLGTGFRCQRCRQVNEILRTSWKGPREPTWFYALDEVVFQGLLANAHVPLLALARVAKSAKSFLHMPEGKVHINGRPEMEIDLWAIADGKIIVGEAKIGGRLEKTAAAESARCQAFKQLAEDLTADEFVMATAGQWRPETWELASQVIGPKTPLRRIEGLGQ